MNSKRNVKSDKNLNWYFGCFFLVILFNRGWLWLFLCDYSLIEFIVCKIDVWFCLIVEFNWMIGLVWLIR